MPKGKSWPSRLERIVAENTANNPLKNKILAEHLGISERHLIRRVKELTGLSPQQYIRQHRLQQARKYLEKGAFRTVKETAAAVSYVNTSYFISRPEKEFGKRPLKALREWEWLGSAAKKTSGYIESPKLPEHE